MTKDRRDGTSADFLLEWRGKPSGRFSSRQATISHSDPSAGTSAEGLGRRTRGSTGTVRGQLDELGAEQADRVPIQAEDVDSDIPDRIEDEDDLPTVTVKSKVWNTLDDHERYLWALEAII